MTIIDGIEVAIFKCDKCNSNELWFFRGENGEGYKISCAKCKTEQRELLNELKLPYLWKYKEVTDAQLDPKPRFDIIFWDGITKSQ